MKNNNIIRLCVGAASGLAMSDVINKMFKLYAETCGRPGSVVVLGQKVIIACAAYTGYEIGTMSYDVVTDRLVELRKALEAKEASESLDRETVEEN